MRAASVYAEQGEETGIPESIIEEDLEWIWKCWHRLHESRQWMSGGMGPAVPATIAWRDVVLWADRHGIDEEMTDYLDRCLRAMDAVFIEYHQEKMANAIAASK